MYKKIVLKLARNTLVAAVSLFSLTLHAASSATLAWNASSSPNITGYTVRYGTASGNYPSVLNAGTALTATVPNLIGGTRYYFVVTARNSSGFESDPSNEISHTPSGTPLPNVLPTLDPISSRTINEDAGQQTVSLTGITAGLLDLLQILTVTASSSNPGLIPNPTVTYANPNTTGTLLLAPVANATGTATITVTVNDGGLLNNLLSRTFTVTVNSVNDAPTLNPINNLALNVNAVQQTVSLGGIGTGAANESQTLAVTATSSNSGLIPTPSVTYTSPGSTGTLRFTPVAGATGTATITVNVNDGQSQNNTVSRSFNVTVSNTANTPPTLNALSNLAINEDAAQQTINLSGITPGVVGETQPLTVIGTSSNPSLIPNPTVTYTSPSFSGTLRFTPAANVSGTATITVTVNDGQSQNNLVSRSFVVTVNPLNDPPTLNPINNLALNVNAVQQTVSLGGIGTGAANESQTLMVTATSSNPGLIPAPSVTYTSPNSTGTVRFTPVAGATGTATITVTVNDGQSLNNTVSRSFNVTVSTANTPPTLNALGNLAINEDAAQQTINLSGIMPGAVGETQALTVTAASSNPSLIPNPTVTYTSPGSSGTLRLTPTANASGTATITVTVNDGQSQNNIISRSFAVTVNPVNDAPTLNALSNLTLATGAGVQTVFLSGISAGAANESQTLTVAATSSNPSLIPAPSLTYTSPSSTGTLRFAPLAGATGTATITVSVNDGQGQNNLVSRNFTVTVSGSMVQTIYVEAESGARVSPMTVGYDASAANGQYIYSAGNNAGTVSWPIGISQAGTYWVWCRVFSPDASRDSFFVSMDGGVEEIFTTAPSGWSSAWQWIRINLSGTIRTFSLSQGSHTLVFRGRDPSTVLDALYITSSPSFVPPASGPPNAPPTLNPLTNLTLYPNGGQRIISLSGITSGSGNESQPLTVAATSSNPSLIPNPTVTYTSPDSSGTLRVAPALNATGTATITVTVNDGQSQNSTISRSFMVIISAPVSLFIHLDAESGTPVAPMMVASDLEASGGRYVYSTTDNQGTISVPINIPVPGTYSIWCRVLSPDNGRDSFFVAADGGTEEIYITTPNTWSSSWQWTKLNGHLSGGERTFNWNAGTHRLVFRGRENSTFLDALYITNDRNLSPQLGLTISQAPIDFSAADIGESSLLIPPEG